MKGLLFIALIFPLIGLSKQPQHPNCKKKYYGYSLKFRKYYDDGYASYLLKLKSGEKINIILRDFDGKQGHDKVGKPFHLSGNCFSFATSQPKNIPGSLGPEGKGGSKNLSLVSFPPDVDKANFMVSMSWDKALFLGKDFKSLQKVKLKVKDVYAETAARNKREKYTRLKNLIPKVKEVKPDPETNYYIIAAYLKREEYHFWGLFYDGWWNKPSKVGKVSGQEELFCPSYSVLTLLNKRSLGAPYKSVGFFLFPSSYPVDDELEEEEE